MTLRGAGAATGRPTFDECVEEAMSRYVAAQLAAAEESEQR